MGQEDGMSTGCWRHLPAITSLIHRLSDSIKQSHDGKICLHQKVTWKSCTGSRLSIRSSCLCFPNTAVYITIIGSQMHPCAKPTPLFPSWLYKDEWPPVPTHRPYGEISTGPCSGTEQSMGAVHICFSSAPVQLWKNPKSTLGLYASLGWALLANTKSVIQIILINLIQSCWHLFRTAGEGSTRAKQCRQTNRSGCPTCSRALQHPPEQQGELSTQLCALKVGAAEAPVLAPSCWAYSWAGQLLAQWNRNWASQPET